MRPPRPRVRANWKELLFNLRDVWEHRISPSDSIQQSSPNLAAPYGTHAEQAAAASSVDEMRSEVRDLRAEVREMKEVLTADTAAIQETLRMLLGVHGFHPKQHPSGPPPPPNSEDVHDSVHDPDPTLAGCVPGCSSAGGLIAIFCPGT